MKTAVRVSLLCALAPGFLAADEPPAKPLEHDLCQTPDNQVMGPRSDDRPLPLLAGDAEHGFHPACAVSWATLSPMGRPLQVLVLNLLYDISQLSIPFDRMDDEYLRKPRKWDAGDIGRFMVWIGPASSGKSASPAAVRVPSAGPPPTVTAAPKVASGAG